MNGIHHALLISLTGLIISTVAAAQTPDPAGSSGKPDSASSPHQRAATGSGAGEAPAGGAGEPSDASTPHQHETVHGQAGHGADSMSAASFVSRAGQDGMTEVALAKVALDKSKSPGIRKFAEQMQQDHGAANSQLMSIASRKGLSAPKKLDAEHQAMVDSLQGKSGAALDSEYAAQMKTAHGKAIDLFTQASRSTDADIAAFATKTLPTLKEHQTMADDLKSTLKTAAKEGAANE